MIIFVYMPIILEKEFERGSGLRAHGSPYQHGMVKRNIMSGGSPILHRLSEDILTANVFGILKNLDLSIWLKPFLAKFWNLEDYPSLFSHDNFDLYDANFHLWRELGVPERQKGHEEGSTQVDLLIELPKSIISCEIKFRDELSSHITTDIPNDEKERPGVPSEYQWDQVIRNLERGYVYTKQYYPEKEFFLLILSMGEENEKMAFYSKYKNNPEVIKKQIEYPIRWKNHTERDKVFTPESYHQLSKNMAWSTWEDFVEVLEDARFENYVEKRFQYDDSDYIRSKIRLNDEARKKGTI
jgi:hypothetical protein